MRERLRFGSREELHASRAELLVGEVDVIAAEGSVEEGTDPILLSFGRQQKQTGLCTGNGKLDPALRPDRPIRRDDAAHRLGPERKRPLLIVRGDANIVDSSEQRDLLRRRQTPLCEPHLVI